MKPTEVTILDQLKILGMNNKVKTSTFMKSLLPNARIVIVLILFIGMFPIKAQADKEKARLGLSFQNYNNNGPRLIATVKYKEDKSYVPVQGIKINFYTIYPDSLVKFLGEGITLNDGSVKFILPESLKHNVFEQRVATYIARIEENERFKDAESEILVQRSQIELITEEVDSVKSVAFFVGTYDSMMNLIPVSDINGKIFVKRLFGELPISKDFEVTDEDGYLKVDFPDDIPGDENGNLEIIARIDDHDDFGTLVAIKSIPWGTALAKENTEIKGELWSSRENAPLYLIVITTSIIALVWGVIFYILFILSQIFREGKNLSVKSL